jgi:hypothetical protein
MGRWRKISRGTLGMATAATILFILACSSSPPPNPPPGEPIATATPLVPPTGSHPCPKYSDGQPSQKPRTNPYRCCLSYLNTDFYAHCRANHGFRRDAHCRCNRRANSHRNTSPI